MTVLDYGTMVYVALAAAEETGIDAEIIDLRTLLPLDLDTIIASVKKTGRCVVVHEAHVNLGLGAELAARVTEECFYSLEAPVLRVGGFKLPDALPGERAPTTGSPGAWQRDLGFRIDHILLSP